MKNILIVLVGLLAVASCNNSAGVKYRTPDYYLEKAVAIKGEPLPTEYISEDSYVCHYTPDGFIGEMKHQNGKLVHLADLQNGEIKTSACTRGRGPGEILLIADSDLKGNDLYLLDPVADKIMKVGKVNDTLICEDIVNLSLKQPKFFVNMEAISESMFAMFVSSRDYLGSIMLIDRNSNLVDSLAYFPLEDEGLNHSAYRYNVQLELSPSNRYLFVSCGQFDCVSKYEIKENKIIPQKKIYLSKPKYEIKNGKPVRNEDYMLFNNRIYAGDKYLYVTVDPETVKDYKARHKKAEEEGRGDKEWAHPGNDTYILVFDYDLNLVKSFRSDCDIINLAVTTDPEVVYATDLRENRLVKYTLRGL